VANEGIVSDAGWVYQMDNAKRNSVSTRGLGQDEEMGQMGIDRGTAGEQGLSTGVDNIVSDTEGCGTWGVLMLGTHWMGARVGPGLCSVIFHLGLVVLRGEYGER
jgi:hypothetical protein